MGLTDDESARALGAQLARKLIEWIKEVPSGRLAAGPSNDLIAARDRAVAGAMIELGKHLDDRRSRVDVRSEFLDVHLASLLSHAKLIGSVLPEVADTSLTTFAPTSAPPCRRCSR